MTIPPAPPGGRYGAPWHVAAVDLAAGVGALALPTGARGALLTFWWGSLPLGDAVVPADQFPLAAHHVRDLAARAVAPAVAARAAGRDAAPAGVPGTAPTFRAAAADPFPSLGGSDEETATPAPAPAPALWLSVVVCTRDRPGPLLARCLASLAAQGEPADEVIVVDNNGPGGDDASDAVRRAVQSAGVPGVRWVREPRPGLSAARNAGLRAAAPGCELVAFTDDDVEAHPDWTRRLRSAFTGPEVAAVTGLVLPAALDTPAQVGFEWGMGGFGQGYAPLRFDRRFFDAHRRAGVPVWRVGAGANMAFRRAVFEELGPFDERLGAGASGCSEDSEFWYRVLAAGHECRYEPAAVAFHRHRDSEAALLSQAFHYMRGHAAALLVQWARHGDVGNLRRLLVTLPAHYARLAWLHARRMPGFDDPLDRRLLGAQVRGVLSGVPYYLRHRHHTGTPGVAPAAPPARRRTPPAPIPEESRT